MFDFVAFFALLSGLLPALGALFAFLFGGVLFAVRASDNKTKPTDNHESKHNQFSLPQKPAVGMSPFTPEKKEGTRPGPLGDNPVAGGSGTSPMVLSTRAKAGQHWKLGNRNSGKG